MRVPEVGPIISLRPFSPDHIIHAVAHGGHLPVNEATLIAGLGGAIVGAVIGFIASRVSALLDDRKQRHQFLNGLMRDVERCQTIDLSMTSDSLQLLNPISFPFIRQIAQGQYMHLLDSTEVTALLKIFYLIENFLRYQEPEMQILLDWIRNPDDDRRAVQLEALRNHAIAPLEAALRDEAHRAYELLKCHRHIRLTVKGNHNECSHNELDIDQRELVLVTSQFKVFHDCLTEKMKTSRFPAPGYTPWWNSDNKTLIFEFHEKLTITNVPEDLLQQPAEGDVEKIYQTMLRWAQSGGGVQTADFKEP